MKRYQYQYQRNPTSGLGIPKEKKLCPLSRRTWGLTGGREAGQLEYADEEEATSNLVHGRAQSVKAVIKAKCAQTGPISCVASTENRFSYGRCASRTQEDLGLSRRRQRTTEFLSRFEPKNLQVISPASRRKGRVCAIVLSPTRSALFSAISRKFLLVSCRLSLKKRAIYTLLVDNRILERGAFYFHFCLPRTGEFLYFFTS